MCDLQYALWYSLMTMTTPVGLTYPMPMPSSFPAEGPRRESKSVRKQVLFKPSTFKNLGDVARARGDDLNPVIEEAVEKEVRAVPLLGSIQCGPASEAATEEIEKWVNTGDLLQTRPGDYLLRAYGDSMTGGDIEEGDFVLIRPQTTCDNNEIAAVMVETPVGWLATLKCVQFRPGSDIVTLQPLNDAHEPIEINVKEQELRICGVYRGHVRPR